MTKKTRILISLVLVAVAFVAGITVYAQSERDRSAQADGTVTTRYTVVDGKIQPPPTSTTAAKGTAENPFFILEIVPYEGMGSIGYHIEGCEPINMQKAAYNSADIQGESNLYAAVPTHTEYRWVSEGKPSYYPASPTKRSDIEQYGTMKYVGDGTGNCNRTSATYVYEPVPEGYEGTTKYVQNGDGTYTEDNENGTLIRRTTDATYEIIESGTGGDYLWTPLPAETCKNMIYSEKQQYEDADHDPDVNGEFKAHFSGVEHYVVENIKTYVHNHNFLKESVGLAYEFDSTGKRIPYQEGTGKPTLEERIAAYKSVVYTVTPEDLNLLNPDGTLVNQDLIDRADLVSISSLATDTVLNAYENYKGYNNVSYDSSGLLCDLNRKYSEGTNKTTFEDNPLDWPTALALYERATSTTDPLPIIWDTHTLTNIKSPKKNVPLKIEGLVNGTVEGSQNNMQKLYLMLHVSSTALFESTFGKPEDFPTTTYTQDGKTYTTPLLTCYDGTEEDQSYWSNQSLYPWKLGILPHETSLDDGTNVTILDTLGIMNNGGSSLFHYNSGGAQNMVRNGFHTFDGSTYLTDGFVDSVCGVQNNQYGREVYEFFEDIQDPQTDLTTAEVLYYLLNGLQNSPNLMNNNNYKILELQPATNYKGGTTSGTIVNDSFWRAFIANYANTTGTVTVDRMSTSEFIGKQVECVSEYDMVYVGVNTLANNWSMDFSGTDYIYAHTGPVIHQDKAAMKGWFDPANAGAEGRFPLSGNDLTELAQTKLNNYVEAGSPVLFGTGFFTSETASEINGNIDRNSNVYDFAENYVSSPIYEYALTKSSTRVATENALRDGLSKSHRVQFTNITWPKLYDEEASESDKYLTGNTLTVRFTVKAPAATKYKLVLYIDNNGDGVFTPDEKMSNVKVREGDYGSFTDGTVKAGVTYVVQKVVEDRKGSVAWKLDIVNHDEFYASPVPEEEKRIVLASLSGLSAIKATEKEPLRILQIMKASGNSLELPMDGETTDPNTVKGKFWAWTRNINGLDISFVRKTEAELVPILESEGNQDYLLENYEMVVLGFGDMYNGVKETVLLNALTEFMEAGKAVLYTHDASSMIGTNDSESWSKEISKAFRDRYGMDRYDVTAYKSRKSLSSGEERADYPYVTTSDPSKIGKLTLHDNQALTQGVTNGHIYRYSKNGGGNVLSKKVTKINSGAITQYPYKIPDSISVSETHPQYYQLDMENKDLTVWYCLATTEGYDSKITDYYNFTSNDVRNNYYIYNYGNVTYSGMGHSVNMSDEEIKLFINTFVAAYRAASKPVQIVVTNDDATRNVTAGEYYLCVDVDSTDSDALLGGAEMGAYESYRLQTADGTGFAEGAEVTAVSKRVEFRINDNSSSTVGNYALEFYLEDSTGTMVQIPLAVYRKSDGAFMDTKTASKKFKSSDTDIYYVDVPMKLETVDGKTAVTATTMNVKVIKTYSQGDISITIPGDTLVNIIPRGLFDLD